MRGNYRKKPYLLMAQSWKPSPINIRLFMEEIPWEMGGKDVPEYTGGGRTAEPGVPAVFLRSRRK